MSVGRHILELNASNNTVVCSYVWGLDLSGSLDGAGGVGGLLWVTPNSGPAAGTHYCCYDGNGNVVGLVSASTGTETARYEYGPFAEPIRVSGAAARTNPFRFSTKRADDTTDLVLYEYRAYSSSLGRWLSRDPIGEEGGKNLYVANRNDSIVGYDPDGRNPAIAVAVPISAVEIAAAVMGISVAACIVNPECMALAAEMSRDIVQGIADTAKTLWRICKPKKRCRPCIPQAGTRMFRVDHVPPSRPHWPFMGTHTHHYVVMQSPVTAPRPCLCWRERAGVTEGISPAPGEIPVQEVGGGGVQYYLW